MNIISEADINKLIQLIDEANRIVICSHENPDGDALGSVLCLYYCLRDLGKDAHALTARSVDAPRLYSFLPDYEKLTPASKFNKKPDLFIMLDTPNTQRLGGGKKLFERSTKKIVIDHHPDTDIESDLTLSLPRAASCSMLSFQLVRELCKKAKVSVSTESASAAYVGLITDTGKFQFQNTDHCAFLAASEMLACGANPAKIASLVYESKSFAALAIEARLVERIKLTDGGKIAYSWVSHTDFEELSLKEDETEGLVSVLRKLAGPSIVILFREHKDHIRCNIRAKGDADVGAIAREFGGGGHVAAAGFTCKGELESAIKDVLPALLKVEAQL